MEPQSGHYIFRSPMASDDSEDILSSSSLSQDPIDTKDQNQDFNNVVPVKAEMSLYFDPAGEKNGVEYMTCKACQEAHTRGELSRVMKIKNKQENLRKHLKGCKFFCAEHGLEAVAKPQRSKATSSLMRTGDETGQPVKFHNPPEGCKMMQVKYSRRIETFDITPGTTAAQIVKDLKIVFGIEDDLKCFLRKESVCLLTYFL
ncbi:hypothetical protein EDI_093170 [Entamoeba dispar SAW760]|uniref:Uncharacterized protein n=1 Tax=Entamoeba dispar (strain ATCC PRA-260 / SAW760) TaxID=370354 RepID=B0EDA9_ENTDS|nr:uncharacterized protein EDI_093170 [Entamoeba dispar SAW760]EDR27526.1 hypothetical protein EDI_093170 [Entamoeba dispar SAW760]|eukprot:EDR27526.1 hypothetical protein EDI_093170 [Entamoeba dispar SAW760]